MLVGHPLQSSLIPKDVMDLLCPTECHELRECCGCKMLCATKVFVVLPGCFSRIRAGSSPASQCSGRCFPQLCQHFCIPVSCSLFSPVTKSAQVLGNVKHLISIPEAATGSPRDSIPGQESLTRHFLQSPFLLLTLFPLAASNFSRSRSLNIIPSISSSCHA